MEPYDMNIPCERRNAYGHFCKKMEEDFNKKNPGKEHLFFDFSRSLLNKWKLLTGEEKKPFQALADQDEKWYQEEIEYRKEIGDYDEESSYDEDDDTNEDDNTDVDDDSKKQSDNNLNDDKKKLFKDSYMPQKALSAFFWFTNDIRSKVKEELPNATCGDVAKKLAELWLNSSSEEKLKYEDIAKKDEKRYQKELEIYNKFNSNCQSNK